LNLRGVVLLLAVSLASPVLRAQSQFQSLEELVHQRRWHELRLAVAQGTSAAFYRAVAAAVFNEPEAESLFKQVIQDEPASTTKHFIENKDLRRGLPSGGLF
jgi:hypothetical protein